MAVITDGSKFQQSGVSTFISLLTLLVVQMEERRSNYGHVKGIKQLTDKVS